MAEFVVNMALIAAVLVALTAWTVSAHRHRRFDRREHAAERRLILAALTGTADLSSARRPAEPVHKVAADPAPPTLTPAPATQLDAASVSALLDLLEDRRPARHGLLAGLITSPRNAWHAGTRAGHNAGRHTTKQPIPQPLSRPPNRGEDRRGAAAEPIDIQSHPADAADANRQYPDYVAAIGDPAVAEPYLRSAAHANLGQHDQAVRVVREISGAAAAANASEEDPPRPPRDQLKTSPLAHRELRSNHTTASINLDHA